uniref:(northern house mosquito) hypothetical protein n=1 Tax=Culex pipiens TaxID=7175 RepID=A0A8D8CE30_CULPI
MRSDRETGYGRAVTPHPGPVGDRSDVTQVCAQAGLGPVWRCLGRSVEQHNAGCHQNAQIGNHGPEGFPRRGADHEEAPAQQADPAVRRVHPRGADLHHHGAHEARLAARVPAG